MTKEDLLLTEHVVHAANGDASYIPLMALNKFFDSNVCIPKGSKIQVSKKETISMASFDDWITVSEYRIKPPEPVYEWQWLVVHHQAYIVSDYGRFMTLEETYDGMVPIEETKRVRS